MWQYVQLSLSKTSFVARDKREPVLSILSKRKIKNDKLYFVNKDLNTKFPECTFPQLFILQLFCNPYLLLLSWLFFEITTFTCHSLVALSIESHYLWNTWSYLEAVEKKASDIIIRYNYTGNHVLSVSG